VSRLRKTLRVVKTRVAVAIAALAALLAVGTAGAARRAETVRVTAKDFKFSLSTASVKAGKVTFTIKNAGHTPHDFEIANHTSKVVAAGKSTSLTVTLKAGSYPYKCTVDSHAKLGMKGVLLVK
jgi:plastocyanin